MSVFEILPNLASYSPDDSIEIEIRGACDDGELTVWHLGQLVKEMPVRGEVRAQLGQLPTGGYGIELRTKDGLVRTAIEVRESKRARLRYGFVTDYSPNRDLSGVSDNIRRLHLSAIQFYDWAYRHADLMGGGDNYKDALNQPISLQTVRDLVGTVQTVGSSALGYAAVYGVGPNEWTHWQHRALLTATRQTYGLGDFLFLVDPASPDWSDHFTQQLKEAVDKIHFDGFHLDQYGYPKIALRADGSIVDLSASFAAIITSVRKVLPSEQLVFNNVNDFPTWVTSHSPQDAIYIEVWEPNITLNSLAHIVNRARNLESQKPIVIAAYQHVFDLAPADASNLAMAFTMATLFSHGATQILAGEEDRILVDPYYVRNHKIEESTRVLLRSWYDFVVEYDELLLDPRIVDVTSSYGGSYNDDCDVTFVDVKVNDRGDPGSIWRRITASPTGLVVHLINLVNQEDTLWDSPRRAPHDPGIGKLKFRRVGGTTPTVTVADPDLQPRMIELEVTLDGEYAYATLPKMNIWQVLLIRFTPDQIERAEID